MLERPEERLLALSDERSVTGDRLVAAARELEPLRSDSVTLLERVVGERVESFELPLREVARSGARSVTLRLREVARLDSARAEPDRLALRSELATLDVARSPPRNSATRSDLELDRVPDPTLRSNVALERRSAAHSRRSDRTADRLVLAFWRTDAGLLLLLSTKRVCSTRPR